MATETTYLSGQGLTITRSQRDPEGPVWWWVRDSKPTRNKAESATYQQREILKGAGARWSRKRRAWYLITPELPDVVQQLVTSDTAAVTPAPATTTTTSLVVNEAFVAVEGGKRLYHTTVHDLARQGLATVLNEEQLNRVYELPGGHLFGGNAFQGVIYHELRRVTEGERETQALREARAKVALYAAWSANLERLSQHLAIPALPAPQAGQPSVQVLPDLADPWN